MATDNGAAAPSAIAMGSEVNGVTFTAFKAQLVVPSAKAEEAVEFYKLAFGAEEVNRSTYPKRKADQEAPAVLCAELKIGGFGVLVCDQTGDLSLSGGALFLLETDDVSGAMANAVQAGATISSEIAEVEEEGCCGGVVGKVADPYGIVWTLASAKGAKKQCEVAEA